MEDQNGKNAAALPRKKPYEAPRVEAEEVFEVMAATCHDDQFTCQAAPMS